ncbi:IS200/IS605 family transposase [Bacillus salipaludis]|uniref:IS200/IS605 family transposase n=1 Tax=Bacillus salipaludis TaxID=2547811 RepID=A0AA90TWP3_9BACI|nr:IS200/IS605 family transposase [Bacillus salipaludis]MDQ6600904.1 IS200/IS605 family transposase [Bacillus salipaludis]
MNGVHSNKYHVSFLQYHITFFTSSHILLNREEKDFIQTYFRNVSNRHEFKIVKMEIQEQQVKLIINCKTTHYIPNIIKALKGGSARFLHKEFPKTKLKNGGTLWDQRYFISTEEQKLKSLIMESKELP